MLASLALVAIVLVSLVASAPAPQFADSAPHALLKARSDGGVVSIPLQRRERVLRPSRRVKRWNDGEVRQLGLGDYADLGYTLSIDVGGTVMEVLLDTGSTDLIVYTADCVSEYCRNGTQSGLPRYDPARDETFQSTGLNLTRLYGTSTTRTFASGLLGYTEVGLAGFSVNHTAFEAINETDLPWAAVNSGLIGAAFPVSSPTVLELFNASITASNATSPNATSPNNTTVSNNHSKSTSPNLKQQAQAYLKTLSPNGGLFSRLADEKRFKSPGFTLTLQRAIDPDGNATSNAGLVTFGGLPSGVDAKALTYKKVHRPKPENWFPLPFAKELPNLPTHWETQIDGVSVNGTMLPASQTAPEIVKSVGNIGLFDSGSSGLFGPRDLVEQIYAAVGFDNATSSVPCDTKIEVSVHIGGKEFAIDPLDWFGIQQQADPPRCIFNLRPNDDASTEVPNSWFFGDIFLRNVLLYHHYGCIENPDADPPKLGFLSTTDAENASARFDRLRPSLRNGTAPVPSDSLIVAAPTTTTSDARGIPTGF